jgi:hypothetical protein
MRIGTLAIVLCSLMSAAPGPKGPGLQTSPGRKGPGLQTAWRSFQGGWSAVGRRQTLPTDRGGTASVVQLSGAVVLTDGDGASFGFQGKAIGFDDGDGVSVGRAVWTDAHGDQLFSTLKGEPLQTGRRITGTIAGGTGTYTGVTGDYTLTWQYVVNGGDDIVQGRSADLNGRFRRNGNQR